MQRVGIVLKRSKERMDLGSGFAGPYLSHSYLQILFSLEKKKKVKRRNSGLRAVLVSLLDLQIISRDSREVGEE